MLLNYVCEYIVFRLDFVYAGEEVNLQHRWTLVKCSCVSHYCHIVWSSISTV